MVFKVPPISSPKRFVVYECYRPKDITTAKEYIDFLLRQPPLIPNSIDDIEEDNESSSKFVINLQKNNDAPADIFAYVQKDIEGFLERMGVTELTPTVLASLAKQLLPY